MTTTTEWGNVHIASPYDTSPDSEMATPDEISHVTNTGNVVPPTPVFNPNMPYADIAIDLNDDDKVLLEAIRKAVVNGWKGFLHYTNDATTIGLEGETMIRALKKRNANVREVVFDPDFAKFLWPDSYKEKLQQMVVSDNVILFLKYHS